MRNPHGASAGLGGALDGGNGGGGGSARRRNNGARVPALGAVYGLRHWAQKGQGEEARLTEGLWRPGTRRRGKTMTTGGGEDRVSVGRAAAEGLGVPWPRRSVGEVPAEVTRGSRQPETGRRRRNWGGGTAHRRRFLHEIPMMQRLGAQLLGSGSLQVVR
jgi:hypothetical protein